MLGPEITGVLPHKQMVCFKGRCVCWMYVVNYADHKENVEEGNTTIPGRTRSGRVATQDMTKESPEKVCMLSLRGLRKLQFRSQYKYVFTSINIRSSYATA